MPMERRCLTEPEMLEKGMALVGHFWVSKRRAAQTIPVDAISSKPVTHFSDAPVVPATLLATDSNAFAFGPHGARGLP